jgi:hypothetical protein
MDHADDHAVSTLLADDPTPEADGAAVLEGALLAAAVGAAHQ